MKRYDPKAFLIASKYPLSGENVVYYDYLPLIVQTTVHMPSGTFSLWVVHTTAPVPGSFAKWKGALNFIAKLVAARGTCPGFLSSGTSTPRGTTRASVRFSIRA